MHHPTREQLTWASQKGKDIAHSYVIASLVDDVDSQPYPSPYHTA